MMKNTARILRMPRPVQAAEPVNCPAVVLKWRKFTNTKVGRRTMLWLGNNIQGVVLVLLALAMLAAAILVASSASPPPYWTRLP